jgi:coenzyme F420-reducing hydrogenase alpha subunit
MAERRTIEVGALARVEGEGALHVSVEGDRVVELRLEIYEPPRFFESFLRGRAATELPDLVARICGICPVAYQMSTIHALEQIFGVEVDPAVRALRRLYYAGEWIESHLLHMTFLAAPDYLGLDDALEIARSQREPVERTLRLRRIGNRILELLGGRPVNPVGVVVGGFSRIPRRAELTELAEALRHGRGEAEVLLRWFQGLPVPRRPREVELVALRHPDEYPMNEGRIASTAGLDVAAAEFDQAFEEVQVEHSTALHCRVRGRGSYHVGPLARLLLNRDHLSPAAQAALASLGDRFEQPDPAASVFARGIEVIQAFDEALAAVDGFEPPAEERPAWQPRAGKAAWATEAPRGVLWVEVETESSGHVREIRIVPPTSQNQARIEDDLRELVPQLLQQADDDVRRSCEAAIRDYDPCISCATHFLKLDLERRPDPCGSR